MIARLLRAILLTAAAIFTYHAEAAAIIAQHVSVTEPQAPQTNIGQASKVKSSGKRVAVLIGRFNKPRVVLLNIPVHGIKEPDDLGLTLVPASDFPKSQLEEGVAISSVDPSSKAAEFGVKRGDIIIGVNSEPVSTVEDVVSVLRKARKGQEGRPVFRSAAKIRGSVLSRFPLSPKRWPRTLKGLTKSASFLTYPRTMPYMNLSIRPKN